MLESRHRKTDRLRVAHALRVATHDLLVNEATLFTSWHQGRPVSEWTICAHLAWNLRRHVESFWDIDVEYNRMGEAHEVIGGSSSFPMGHADQLKLLVVAPDDSLRHLAQSRGVKLLLGLRFQRAAFARDEEVGEGAVRHL